MMMQGCLGSMCRRAMGPGLVHMAAAPLCMRGDVQARVALDQVQQEYLFVHLGERASANDTAQQAVQAGTSRRAPGGCAQQGINLEAADASARVEMASRAISCWLWVPCLSRLPH